MVKAIGAQVGRDLFKSQTQHTSTPVRGGSRVVKAISAQVGRDCVQISKHSIPPPPSTGEAGWSRPLALRSDVTAFKSQLCCLAATWPWLFLGLFESLFPPRGCGGRAKAGRISCLADQRGCSTNRSGGSWPRSNAGAVPDLLGASGSEAAGSSRAEGGLCRQWVGKGLRMSSTWCEPRCTGHSDRNTPLRLVQLRPPETGKTPWAPWLSPLAFKSYPFTRPEHLLFSSTMGAVVEGASIPEYPSDLGRLPLSCVMVRRQVPRPNLVLGPQQELHTG